MWSSRFYPPSKVEARQVLFVVTREADVHEEEV
jgi:hypothetical protein